MRTTFASVATVTAVLVFAAATVSGCPDDTTSAPSIQQPLDNGAVCTVDQECLSGACSESLCVPANLPPTVNPGPNRVTLANVPVLLSAAESFDPERQGDPAALNYSWELKTRPAGSTPNLTGDTTVEASFVGDLPGVYEIELTVTDEQGAAARDSVAVFVLDDGGSFTLPDDAPCGVGAQCASGHCKDEVCVSNSPPLASAGSGLTVQVGEPVTVSSEGSADPDGDPLTYGWVLSQLPEGSTVTLSDDSSAEISFTPDVPGLYVVRLFVNDGYLSSAPATAAIVAVEEGAAQLLADGEACTADTQCESQFCYQQACKTNEPPVADAGANQTVALGATVSLDGAASNDPENAALTYQWSLLVAPDGATATIAEPTLSVTSLVPDVAGTWVARLIVNDGTLDAFPADIVIEVTDDASLLPDGSDCTVDAQCASGFCDAGSCGTNTTPVASFSYSSNGLDNPVNLDGSASSDADGHDLTYTWNLAVAPPSSSATLSAADTATTSFTPDVEGSYVVTLVVDDGYEASLPATQVVTVGASTGGPVVTVTQVTPASGPSDADTVITVRGTQFLTGASVLVGLDLATDVTLVDSTTLTAVVPPSATIGAKDVQVVVPNVGQATLPSGFFHFDTTSPLPGPALLSVEPSIGPVGGGTVARLTVDGADLTATVLFGGVEGEVLGYDGDSTLVVRTPAHDPGPVPVAVVMPDGQAAVLDGAFSYYVPDAGVVPPSLLAINPDTGSTAGGDAVSLSAANLGPGTLAFIGYRSLGDVDVPSPSQLTGTTPAHPAGATDVVVTRADGFSATLPASFTFGTPAPVVDMVFPSQGSIDGGTTVVLSGENFVDGATVEVGGVAATTISVPSTQVITFDTPPGNAGAVDITVTNPDAQQTVVTSGFTYVDTVFTDPPPSVTTLVPANGPFGGGTVLAIYGSDFQPGAIVLFGATPGEVHWVGDGVLTVTSPPGFVGTADITVINSDSQASTAPAAFTYLVPTAAPPSLFGTTPAAGPAAGGTPVIFTGSNFASGGTGFIGYRPLSSWSVLSVAIATGTTLPLPAGALDVVVTNGDGQSATLAEGFDAAPAPMVDSFDPAVGPVGGGTVVTIAGSGFVAGATVLIGGQDASATVQSEFVITATAPAAAGPGPATLEVINPDGQNEVAAEPFLYALPPTPSEAFPAQGAAGGGNPVIVTGTDFLDGATVTFGGVAATNVIWVDSEILTMTAPSGTIGETVDITVINPDGQNGVAFGAYTYVDPATQGPAPSVGTLSPAQGPVAGGTWGTVALVDTNPAAMLLFGNAPAVDFHLASSGTGAFVTPPATGPGSVDVTIINPDGTFGVATDAFEYLDDAGDAPDVLTVSPNVGPTSGGTQVDLVGTGLDGETVVFFGEEPATGATYAAGVLTVTTPANDAGLVDVTVTSATGASGSVVDGFEYLPPPVLDTIAPNEGPAAGGTTVTLTGSNFVVGASPSTSARVLLCEDYDAGTNCATIDSATATALTETEIVFTTPTKAPGFVDVAVVNPDQQAAVLYDGFFILPPPTISSVTPDSGTTLGGEVVTIGGSDFQVGVVVTVSGTPCQLVTLLDANTIECTTPVGAAGPAAIEVLNPDGGSDTLPGAYTYIKPPSITTIFPTLGPEAGGTSVTLQGDGFVAGSVVSFGTTDVPTGDTTVVNDNVITVVTPPGVGPVAVVVTNPDSQTGQVPGGFFYIPPVPAPAITAVYPALGSELGGTPIQVVGNNFQEGVLVELGSDALGWGACNNIVVQNAGTLITCVTPAGPAGFVNVRVRNTDGQDDVAAGAFEYTQPNALPGLAFYDVQPDRGPESGGFEVTLSGQGMFTDIQIFFGDEGTGTWVEATVTYIGPTLVKLTVPDYGTAGPADIRLVNTPFFGPPQEVIATDAFTFGQSVVWQIKGLRLPPDNTTGDAVPLIFDADQDGRNDITVFRSQREDFYKNVDNPVTGTPGDFQDLSATTYPDNTISHSLMRRADIDGDGDIDAVFNYANGLRTYRNEGDGTFVYANTGMNANNIWSYEFADLNCDGIQDAFVGRNGGNMVFIGNGTGGYSAAPGGTLPGHSEPTRGVALADVDLDGDIDVLVANDNAFQNRLYYNNCNNISDPADWQFADAAYGTGLNFPVSGFNSKSVVLADFNGDSYPDAFIANAGQSSRFYFNNGGNFLNDTGLNFPQDTSPWTPGRMDVLDFDKDGDLDLIIRREKQGGRFFPEVYTNDLAQGGPAILSLVDDAVAFPTWRGEWPIDYDIGDLDGDTYPDIYMVIDNEQDWLFIQNGFADNQAPIDANRVGIGSWVNNTFYGMPEDIGSTNCADVGDVDGDGDLDIIMGHNGTTLQTAIWINDGAGNFFEQSEARIPYTNCDHTACKLADMNNDGDLDIVLTCDYQGSGVRLLANDGTGYFTDKTAGNVPTSSSQLYSLNIEDVDADGDLDVLIGSSNNMRVLRNLGEAFNDDGAYMIEQFPFGSQTTQILGTVIADLNGNGVVDVYLGRNGSQNLLFHDNGTGGWSNVSSTHLPSVSDATRATFSDDFDEDGDVDLFVVNYNQSNRLHMGELDWKYADVTASAIPIEGNRKSGGDMGDIDGDGLNDIVMSVDNAKNRLILNQGAGIFQDFTVDMPDIVSVSRCIVLGDFDNSGTLDAFICNDQANRIYLNMTPTP